MIREGIAGKKQPIIIVWVTILKDFSRMKISGVSSGSRKMDKTLSEILLIDFIITVITYGATFHETDMWLKYYYHYFN